jgi:hypothetical protein
VPLGNVPILLGLVCRPFLGLINSANASLKFLPTNSGYSSLPNKNLKATLSCCATKSNSKNYDGKNTCQSSQ